jgi:hypothetical protein
MRPRFHNLGALARLVAAVCALALTFGDVARDLHLLFAAHVVCAAHGELVEAVETVAASSERHAAPVSVTAGMEGLEGDHEHCWAQSSATRTQAISATEATIDAIRFAPVHMLVAPAPGARRGTDVLAYAPKQGPPAA